MVDCGLTTMTLDIDMLLRDDRRGGGKGGLRELNDFDASLVKLSTDFEVRRLRASSRVGVPRMLGGLEAEGLSELAIGELTEEALGELICWMLSALIPLSID